MDTSNIYTAVTKRYSALASANDTPSAYGKSIAQSFGYSEQDLDAIPTQANLGLSCGNPLAIASLQEGEVVIDLGSGAGFDVFLAATKVGKSGRVIGIDMNQDMLELAKRNKAQLHVENVELIESRITSIPLASGIADLIISNCVINLVPELEKQQVFNEIFRLLRRGGRVSISDTLAKKPIPDKLRNSVAAYVGCIAGASLVSQYETYLKTAGFSDSLLENTNGDLNVYMNTMPDGSKRCDTSIQACTIEGTSCRPPRARPPDNGKIETSNTCCTPPREPTEDAEFVDLVTEFGDIDLNEWVGSFNIFAIKDE